MQDTVDQAHSAVPRTLADIIQDARSGRVWPLLRRLPLVQPGQGGAGLERPLEDRH